MNENQNVPITVRLSKQEQERLRLLAVQAGRPARVVLTELLANSAIRRVEIMRPIAELAVTA